MKRFALLSLSVCLVSLGAGCCHWWQGCGSPCGPGGCGVTPGLYPSGAIYNSYDSIQGAALPTTTIGPVTATPVLQPSRFQRTTLLPLESLPTY